MVSDIGDVSPKGNTQLRCSCGHWCEEGVSEGISSADELNESDSIVESIAKHVFGEDIMNFVDSDVDFSYEDSFKLHSTISNYPNLIKIAMQSTLVKDMVSDINIARSCIETNPLIVELEEINPGFRHFINDSSKLKEVISLLQDSESYVDFPRTKKVIQTMVEQYMGRKLVFKSELSSKRLQSRACSVDSKAEKDALRVSVDSLRASDHVSQPAMDSPRISSYSPSPEPSPAPSMSPQMPPRSTDSPQSPTEERVRNDKLRDLLHSCNHHSMNHLHHTLREMIAHANTDQLATKSDVVVRNPWKELETLDDPSVRQNRNGSEQVGFLTPRVHQDPLSDHWQSTGYCYFGEHCSLPLTCSI